MPDDTAMTARQAWDFMVGSPGHGVRTGGIHVYMPAPGIVEVSRAGSNDSVDMGMPEFLNDFSSSGFVPLDTTDYAA